jgi:hypothetical protein
VNRPKEPIVNETVEFWSARLGRSVASEEAEEMISNVTRYFDILARWKRDYDRASVDRSNTDDELRQGSERGVRVGNE